MKEIESRSHGASKYIIGIIVTALSLLILAVTLYEAAIHIGADFPCISGLAPQPEFNVDTQIAYCISHWPRQPSFGGDIYAVGSSSQDTIAINRPEMQTSTLILKRQGHTLCSQRPSASSRRKV